MASFSIGLKAGRIPLALAALLALAGEANAQLACFTGQMYGRDSVIAMAAFVMLMIVAVAYMMSKFMGRPEWEAWAKTEAYQVAVSCFLAASMILIADTACAVSWDFTSRGGHGGDAFVVSQNFLQINYERTLDAITTLYKIRTILEYLSSYNIMMATNPQYLVQRYPGLMAISQNLNTAIGIFSILAGNIMVQKIIIQIIFQIAFNVVLPLGLVLRIFPITRDAGSFLIAVAFGFYIVFPLLYVLSDEVMRTLPDEDPPRLQTIFGTTTSAFPMPGPFTFIVASFFVNPIGSFMGTVKNLDFVLVATFFPALNIVVTMAFIKSMTKFIIHQTG